jgi:hypothetical protein
MKKQIECPLTGEVVEVDEISDEQKKIDKQKEVDGFFDFRQEAQSRLLLNGDYQTVADMMAEDFFIGQLSLTRLISPELKELNFIKTSIKAPDGGLYLMAITHVSGPKIQLKKNEDEV